MRRTLRQAVWAVTFMPTITLAASYTWTAGPGMIAWDTGWTPAGFPGVAADVAVIPSLPGPLAIPINVTTATVGQLTFGSAGFLTDIGSNNATGNPLTLNNAGGSSNATIVTTGNATNVITAPIVLLGNANFGSASLTNLFVGSITASGGVRQFNNNAVGRTLTINGTLFAAAAGATTGGLIINGNGSSTIGSGNVVINGGFSANGVSPASSASIALGTNTTGGSNVVRSTITLNANNSSFAGDIALAKADIVLTSDANLGTGRLLLGGGSNVIDASVTSASARVISNAQVQIQQFHAFTGSNAFTFNGKVFQSASRGTGNFLTGGAAMTLNNGLYSGGDAGNARTMNIDGPGTTVIQNGLHNGYDATNNVEFNVAAAAGSYDKRGTGVAVINGVSTYLGGTRVRGGTLEFATFTAYGLGSAAGTGITVEAGGAVGLRTGSLNPVFLARIALGGGANPNTIMADDVISMPNTTNFPSHGAVALTNNDTLVAISYATGGNLSAPFLQTLGIGAASAGANYAAPITPAANTYRLGGGGKLTLTNPSGNQLTGTNSVVATNGGVVAINGNNNYTGATRIGGVYINPSQELIRFGQSTSAITTSQTATLALRASSTISVTSLADGGSPSGIGSSGNSASNLVLDGGTLQYTGVGSSTNRLMTVTANGATLDASGAGAVIFTNPGAVVMQDPVPRGGVLDFSAKTILYLNDPSDLTVGMGINGTGIAAGTTVRAILPPSFNNIGNTTNIGPYQIVLSLPASGTGYQGIPDLQFTGANRTLSFAGTGTAANTFAGAIANSAGGGTVSISKTGAGTWGLGGSNSYTGSTTVTAGTLLVYTGGSLPGASAVTVGGTASTATLKIGAPITLNLSNLTLAGNGRFDLGRGTLNNTTDGGGATALATTKALVLSGFADGAWTGPGYVTSSGDATHGVGYKDTAGGIRLRYTLFGDADLDGGVSINDFNALAGNFGQAGGKFWADGDFDYDGGVSINDFNLLATSFGQTVPANSPVWEGLLAFAVAHNDLAAFQAVTGVPEPAGLGLLAAGAVAGLRRRRDG